LRHRSIIYRDFSKDKLYLDLPLIVVRLFLDSEGVVRMFGVITDTSLPEFYSGEEKGLEALAQVKFFTPDSSWSWYVSEFDDDDLLFGLVVGHEIELELFSLSELQGARRPWGLPIERDKFFEPKTLVN